MRYAVIGFVVLAGCMEAPEPGVSDWNGSAVKVIGHTYVVGNDPRSPIYQKASEMCATVGKRASFGAMKQVNEYQGEHTYLCV